jgi:hypothetical protein
MKNLLFALLRTLALMTLTLLTLTSTPAVAVSSLPAVKLGFATGKQYVIVNTCSKATSVNSLDTNGALAPVSSPTTVFLGSSSTTLTYYSDSTCNTIATSVTIPAGAYHSSNFYFKDSVVHGVSINVAATLSAGSTSATQADNITNPATKILFFNGKKYVQANHCSSAVQVQSYDGNNAISPVAGKTTVTYTSGSASNKFYLDAGCTILGNVVSMTTGTWKSPNIFFKDSNVESLTITATATAAAPGGINSMVQQTESVTNPPTKLVFYTAAQKVAAGVCSKGAGIQTEDSAGNIAPVVVATPVSLVGTGTTKFYSNSTCSTGITAINVAAGGYRTSYFYFKDTAVETLPITASASGLTSYQQNETITTIQHSVTLTWNASTSTNVAGYNVYRSVISGGSYAKIGTTGSGIFKFVDSGVVSGDTYYYVVTAFDNSSPPIESGYSNEAQAIIPYP